MRHAFLSLACAFALLAACSSNTLPSGGDGSPAPLDLAGCSPNCPDLATAPVDLAAPIPDFSGTDLSGISCVTTCQHCISGGACCPGAPNNGCCNSGEWCDNGTCRCGSRGACPANQTCASGGPQPGPGGNSCGFICCGAGAPCPL